MEVDGPAQSAKWCLPRVPAQGEKNELGPNWLDIMTGRARTDEEEVGGVQEDEQGEGR